MKDLNEFIPTVEKFCNLAFDEIAKERSSLNELSNFYFVIHNEKPCCHDTLETFYKSLINFYRSINTNYQKPTKMPNENSKFQLKDKMKIYSKSQLAHITNETLTDEIAIELLKENPGRASCFSVLPKDWKEMTKAKSKEVAKDAAGKDAAGKDAAGK